MMELIDEEQKNNNNAISNSHHEAATTTRKINGFPADILLGKNDRTADGGGLK